MNLRPLFHIRRHQWEGTGRFETRYLDSAYPLYGEWLECYCGARKWDITRAAVKDGLEKRGFRMRAQ